MRKRRYVPTPGVAAASDGLVGLGVGTGPAVARLLRDGRSSRVDRGSVAVPRAHRAGPDDRRVGRGAHRRRGARPGVGLPHPERADRATAPTPRPSSTSASGTRSSTNPRDGATNPRPPFRLDTDAVAGEPARAPGRRPRPAPLPFSGLRVLDMTAYWAGPLVGHVLALLGAEVIHLESPTRPDGVRLVGGVPQTEEHYWERGPIFAALNSNKKSLTIDLSDARGVELVRRFVATCDVVVENYTPRVLDQIGLQLRVAPGGPARPRDGADAGVRARRPVAGSGRVRLRHRGRLGAHVADGPRRPAPDRAVLRRRPQRRPPRAGRAAARPRAPRPHGRRLVWWRRRWSTPR